MPACLLPSGSRRTSMTTMIGKPSVKTSYRATASVIAIAIASLSVPSLAQAKRMGSSKSVRPASIGAKAPAQPAPVAPAAAAPKAAAPAAPAPAAAPAAAAAVNLPWGEVWGLKGESAVAFTWTEGRVTSCWASALPPIKHRPAATTICVSSQCSALMSVGVFLSVDM